MNEKAQAALAAHREKVKSGEYVGTWMNKQECQQLMLVCERLVE